MPNPFRDNEACNRCGIVGQTIWHVCRACSIKAQQAYREQVKAVYSHVEKEV